MASLKTETQNEKENQTCLFLQKPVIACVQIK